MHYRIDIHLKNKDEFYFSTSKRSIGTFEELCRMYWDFVRRFPKAAFNVYPREYTDKVYVNVKDEILAAAPKNSPRTDTKGGNII